ncbi:hypothetical protein LTR84_006890 [Exophiala bonariae]|uniref:Cytochrome b561 domain-containing protein n=1 Tax=Exophiala bonariae TaxID=1690606 RepID=A0AAV9N3Z5_9EURO|nr:hypothetical protein LTR84_006890 [Exophiala bonariae]
MSSFDPSNLPPGFEIPGQKALVAHAAIMCIVFVLSMPIAALTTRSPIKVKVTKLHAPWQMFNVILAITGLGLGASVASNRKIASGETPHILLGCIIVGLLIGVQPVLGILHHLFFRKNNRRGTFGWIHLLLGRIIMVLGLVNGATGFKLAHDNKTVPYFAMLGVVCTVYIGVLLWDWLAPHYKAHKSATQQASVPGHTSETIDMSALEHDRH